jgi:uncharacterized membrane protein YukC
MAFGTYGRLPSQKDIDREFDKVIAIALTIISVLTIFVMVFLYFLVRG